MNKRDLLLLHIITLSEAQGVVFGQDVHTVSFSQAGELQDWAGVMSYRKSSESSLSVGRAFYQYLSRVKQRHEHLASE